MKYVICLASAVMNPGFNQHLVKNY